MALFGKKKISEKVAAEIFVASIFRQVDERWPGFIVRLCEDLGVEPQKLDPDSTKSKLLLALAVIALQMQALPNLLPSDVAIRVRSYVLESLKTRGLGSLLMDTIQELESEWKRYADFELALHTFGNFVLTGFIEFRAGLKNARNNAATEIESYLRG